MRRLVQVGSVTPRSMLVAVALLAMACGDDPTQPTPAATQAELAAASKQVTSTTQRYASGSHVDTWNAIIPATAFTQSCPAQPSVALSGPQWTNPHKAFVANGAAFRSWTSGIFYEDWINAWPSNQPWGTNGVPEWYGLTAQYGGPAASHQQSWTRYSTPVSGTGTFDLYLAADNCSWIYITDADGSNPRPVGAQTGAPWVVNIKYPVTLNGDHKLEFLVLDLGGQAGGMFRLETSTTVYSDTDGDGLADVTETNVTLTSPTNPDTDGDGINDGAEVNAGTNPRNADTDGDGAPDGADQYPLDPTRGADSTPPSIVADVNGTLSASGWYTSDISIAWTVTDGESAVTSPACTTSNVTSDTQSATFSCTATSAGGTATKSVTIKRDATTPVLAFSGNAGSYTVDQTVAISCSASDAMSGMASSNCPTANGAAYTFAIGANTLTASGSDNAGNSNSAATTFSVAVTSGSVCALVERFVSNAGVANSMCVKLRQGSYGAFRNELSAQGGKKFLSAANAAILLRLVNLLG